MSAISDVQPIPDLCAAPHSSGADMSEPAGSKEQPRRDETAAHDADVSSAHELSAHCESKAQPAAPTDEAHREDSSSPAAAEGMAAEPESASTPLTEAAIGSGTADMHVDPEADSAQPADSASAPQLEVQDCDVQPNADSMSPVHRRQLSGQASSGAQTAHQRQLSGESSKGSALSGNPYAGSCGGSRADSIGNSPAGSLEPPEPIQTHLQHELSGTAVLCVLPLCRFCCRSCITIQRILPSVCIHRAGRE